MRLWGPNGPAEVTPALSHGWWKGWRGPKPLTADFRDRGRGFNVLSVYRLHRRLTLGSDMNEMPHLRLATSVAFQPLLQTPIRARRALMLAEVLRPGADQKRFEVDISVFDVPEDSPA